MDDLKAAGCEEVFFEKVSSTTTLDKRHQLRACLSVLREKDQLVVAKLDRLGRSQVEVINRLLCNLANLQSNQRRDLVDNFRKYGVLLEGILTQLDKQAKRQEEQALQMQRLMALGMWWEEERDDA